MFASRTCSLPTPLVDTRGSDCLQAIAKSGLYSYTYELIKTHRKKAIETQDRHLCLDHTLSTHNPQSALRIPQLEDQVGSEDGF